VSLRKAINDKCRDCIYDQFAAGNWRQQVQACSVTLCPLYPYRPVSSGGKLAPQVDTDREIAQ
jgi:hypothetical protein